MPKVTSLGMLLVVAIVAAGGIVLLDTFYLRPHIETQKWTALQERVALVEQAVQSTLKAEEDSLLNAGAVCADSPEIKRFLGPNAPAGSFKDFAELAFGRTNVDTAWLTDASGRTVGSWSRETPDGGQRRSPENAAALRRGQQPEGTAAAKKQGGLIRLPGGIAVFRRIGVRDETHSGRALGGAWLARHIGAGLLDKIGSAVNAKITLIPEDTLPEGKALGGNLSHPFWIKPSNDILTAWPVHEVTGRMVGYFLAELPGGSIFRQATTARRVILIVLSLSLGLTLLVVTWTHMLFTGPVVRLLRRLRQVEGGKSAPGNLTRGLHGEPLRLAKHLEGAFEKLSVMAKTDQLTGLPNRRHFEQVLSAFYHQARRYDRPLSLVAMDIDFFKAVNDTWGHQAGDEVLRMTAGAVAASCRQADIPARIGGDEFCIILPETGASAAHLLAERIRNEISRRVMNVGTTKISLAASFGVADLNSSGAKSPDAMMALVDEALYMAKRLGRNRVFQANRTAEENRPSDVNVHDGLGSLARKVAGLDSRLKHVFLRGVEEIMDVMAQRDPYKANHSRNVRHYAALIAQELHLSPLMVERIGIAAILHDVGMMALPDDVLQCDGALSQEQTEIVRQHPLLSARIMEGMEFLEQETHAVRHHHERYDGRGYPDGISGTAIPLPARILAVADAFDAITSPRSFHDARTLAEGLQELESGSGMQFDPMVIEAFLAVARKLGHEMMPKQESAVLLKSAEDGHAACAGA